MLNYKRQLLLPMLFACLILGLALFALFLSSFHLMKINALDNNIDAVRYQIIELESDISKTEAAQRGYLLTNNLSFSESFNSAKEEVNDDINAILYSLEGFPEVKPSVYVVKKLVTENFSKLEVAIHFQQNYGAYSPHLNSAKMGLNATRDIQNKLDAINRILYQKKTGLHEQIHTALKQAVWFALAVLVIIVSLLYGGYRKAVQLFEAAVNSSNAAEMASHDAYHDMLTKLPNRRYFDAHLKRVSSVAKRGRQTFALLYLDLDGFKFINDQYGHDAGDIALCFAAERFKSALRESDLLARTGGDEFAVVIENYFSESELLGLANRMLRYIKQPFDADGNQCQLGVSIGIAQYPLDGQDMDTLMKEADEAMYKAKRDGKNRVELASEKRNH